LEPDWASTELVEPLGFGLIARLLLAPSRRASSSG
jgi:hypothetical protein